MKTDEHKDIKNFHTQSELDEEESNNSNYKVYAFLSIGTLILGILFFQLWKNYSKEPEKDLSPNIEKAVVEKKRFMQKSEAIKTEEVLPLLPSTALPRTTFKAKIIKGAGSTRLNFAKQNQSRDNASFSKTDPLKNPQSIFRGSKSSIAGVHHFKSELYLPKGTYIGCSLKTRIVSSVGGGVGCTVSNNIYSADGNVLLIERGSSITGSYKSATLENGIDRLYVIWEEIRTRNNIIISVDSAASDELGSAGIHGEVDNHWGIRIGAALLVSIIDDTMGALAQRAANNNQTNYLLNTGQQTEDMASVILDKFINIKPTLYKNHGDTVGVYVNQDIDFSKVYKLTR